MKQIVTLVLSNGDIKKLRKAALKITQPESKQPGKGDQQCVVLQFEVYPNDMIHSTSSSTTIRRAGEDRTFSLNLLR